MSEPNATVASKPQAARRVNVKTITSLSMLTALAYIAMYVSKILPQIAGFLQLEVKDTVICIGGFVFGPLAAAIISIVVALIEMFTVSDTGIIGCIMNVIATVAFCCTASFVYKKMHTKKGAVIGLSLGVLVLAAVMVLWNYLITPLYMTGFSRSDIAAMLVPIFLPFNLLKGALNMALCLVLYKPVVTALRRAHLVPESGAVHGSKKSSNAGMFLFTFALVATFVVLAMVMMGKI